MKIVVIGGAGLIGAKTVAILRQAGHEVVAASRRTGINIITGEGLAEAMVSAQVLIDLSNPPPSGAASPIDFFEIAGRTLLAAEVAAGVRHHVTLSIVGADRAPGQRYYRAKVAQERLVETSGLPYTIIRATQFLEFLGAIADGHTQQGAVSFRRPCFSRSRPTRSPRSSLRSRSVRRKGGSSRSRAPNARRSPRWSLAI
jgi:uncharacterized protein YbjT (DUF2867 family)